MSFKTIWMDLLIKALYNISEPLRLAVKESVLALEEKAAATTNPWDDQVMALLKAILFISNEEDVLVPGKLPDGGVLPKGMPGQPSGNESGGRDKE